MPICGAVNPDDPDMLCTREPGHVGRHEVVRPGVPPLLVEWVSAPNFPTPVAPVHPTSPAAHHSPVVRTDDPWTSHLAAERIEPQRGTNQAEVLGYLRAHEGEWVDSGIFIGPGAVGGMQGDRRLRELREDMHWPIKARRKPGTSNSWQHRLSFEEE